MKKVPGRDAQQGIAIKAIVTARTSGAEAPCFAESCGTAEELALSGVEWVPLSKTVRASWRHTRVRIIRRRCLRLVRDVERDFRIAEGGQLAALNGSKSFLCKMSVSPFCKAVAAMRSSLKSERDETGMPRTIEQQIKATYFALRIGAALIAFVFPLLLWGGGKLAGFTLRDSMSAYYRATPHPTLSMQK